MRTQPVWVAQCHRDHPCCHLACRAGRRGHRCRSHRPSTRNSARSSTRSNSPTRSRWRRNWCSSRRNNTAPRSCRSTNPLTNLATVHFKLGNYPAAIENYQRTLRILQAKSTIADKQQIRPLHGLGVSFMGANDPESAVVALKRAADLSRNTDGLFNINQIEFIDALIERLRGHRPLAGSGKGSALRIARRGSRARPHLHQAARPPRQARALVRSRSPLHQRTRIPTNARIAILQKNAPGNDLRRVGPLRGIARAFRLESFYGVEGADTGGGTFNPGTGAPVFTDGTQQRRGESALTAAMAIIDSNLPVDQQMRGEVLTDLGDWYLIANALRRAYDTYADAWKAFAQVNNTRYLEAPRILAYRPSISSIDRSQLDPEEAVLKTVELHFSVDRDGRIDNVTSPTTDVPDNVVKSSAMSMKRSRYAPRIENGAAVPTQEVVFVERVLVRVTSQSSSSATTAPPSATEAAKVPEAPKESAPEEKPAEKKEP